MCQKCLFRAGNYVTSKGSSLRAGPRQAVQSWALERVNKQGLNLPGKAEEAVTNTRATRGQLGTVARPAVQEEQRTVGNI